ncbi:restriction endonuclease subunit S [Enterococcus faecalis]|uniref:restriction endonuclease subunit S n=1 Tax=Enterococcus TaxID=1350 RepID=UPI00066854AC|nr:restriction endonuclease subunit S [Enterococcus faecalis]EGO2577102.1 restriction endonuclease subunit S [Enterococcus faecalis]EGO7503884.1 restriction endonuclease subunit S [Enterococcus faecalis]EGO8081092.1 restriction endonuclease subunit S [Enterococcus faecalis]EJI7156309.1 restriction endonuclease subunit S [Enterococcus faecalis]ELU9008617.1 restriction endonuclease subunit S [Enterococcus faecalis]
MSNEITKEPEIRFDGYEGDWEERKVGEVFSERSERSGEGELISVTINSGVVKASELDRKDNSSDDKSNYKKVEVGDIAYNSMRMWQGASGYSPYNGILSPAYTVIIPKKDIDSKFFAYDFKRYDMIQTFKRNSQGLTSDTWNLKFPTLKSVKVMVPSIEEQKQISTFFESLDTTITLHQRELDLLEQTKQTYLKKMFPKTGEDKPEIRFAGFTDAWEQRKLGDYVIDYVEKTTVQNQFPVLTSSQQRGIVFQEDYFANRQVTTDNNVGYFVLPRGYFTYRSRSDNNIFVFNRNDIVDKGIISYFYPVFTLKSANPDFFLKRINNGIQRQLSIQAEGTGQHVLSLKKFKNIIAKFPNEKEQAQIGNFFKHLDNAIALHQRELDSLKEMKKTLLQKMFV